MAFPQLPGGAKIWRVKRDGKWRYFAVYHVPGKKIPGRSIPLMWRIRNKKELKALTGKTSPKVARRMTWRQAKRLGGVWAGWSDEIRVTDDHPLSDFWQLFKRQAKINPMLRDRQVIARFVTAVLEGRQPTTAELHDTRWWRSRTAEERAWAVLSADSPKEARQRLQANRYRIRDMLVGAGFHTGNAWNVASHLAEKVTKGHQSEAWLEQEIKRWTDPYAEGAHFWAGRGLPEGGQVVYNPGRKKYYYRRQGKDYEIGPSAKPKLLPASYNRDQVRRVKSINRAGWVADIAAERFGGGRSRLGGEEEVHQLIREWLGPVFSAGWDQDKIGRWAHRIRDAEGARDQLIEELKRERQAVLPDYEPDLTYDQIAQPWRGVVQSVWGQLIDERDPLFTRLIKNNDQGVNEALLRSEGLKRNIGQVERDAVQSFSQAFGGQISGVM